MTLMLTISIVTVPMLAQPIRSRSGPPPQRALAAENSARQAAEQLAADRKIYERDVEVLRHLRAADKALVDPMQPATAVQKAHEEIAAAKALGPEPGVLYGLIRAEREVEAARLSPATADFGHLRSVIRDQALVPASRVVVRNVSQLQEETLAWIKVQELIAAQLRALSEISGESLRASEQ
ncbi:MAG: hypothetical protein ABI837_17460 [Acidobacteriota bacterium]